MMLVSVDGNRVPAQVPPHVRLRIGHAEQPAEPDQTEPEPEQSEPDDTEPAQDAPLVARPPVNAPKSDWVAYAVAALGLDEDDADAESKQALIDRANAQ